MNEPEPKRPGYNALRRGRVNVMAADYFLTFTLRERMRPASLSRVKPEASSSSPVGRGLPPTPPSPEHRRLHDEPLRAAIITRCREVEQRGLWIVRAAMVMPDHVHLLCRLTSPSLADAVRAWKGGLAPALRAAGLYWQTNYYEHRVRPDQDRVGILRYMWLNPHRAGFCAPGESWPGWWCDAEAQACLQAGAQSETPPPEWWR